MRWIISVTAGKWQLNSIQQAKSAGFNVFAIDNNPNAEGFSDADINLCCDIFDIEHIFSKLNELSIIPSGVSSFTSEAGMYTAACIREQFNLLGLKIKDTEGFVFKHIQRETWDKAGMIGPKWFTANSFEEFLSKIDSINSEVIIKPVDGAGSRGVNKFHKDLNNANECFEEAIKFSRSGKIIVEEFIDGIEFTSEVFADNGKIHVLAITNKKKIPGTFGTVSYELATPELDKKTIELIENATIKAFAELGLKNGPGHAELFLCPDKKVKMVEAAARGGGFMVFDKFVPTTCGVNIARATALSSCALPVSDELKEKYLHKRPTVLRFLPTREGIVKRINGFDEASKLDNVEVGCFVAEGEILSNAKADNDRMGYILCHARTPQLAQDLANYAESLIDIEIKEKR